MDGLGVRADSSEPETAAGTAENSGSSHSRSKRLDIELVVRSCDEASMHLLRVAVDDLRAKEHSVRGRVTFEPGDAERFAREAALRGADLVLAAGGDGTLNEVANGILAAPGGSPADRPALGIIPLGTANDLAHWLNIPFAIQEAVDTAVGAVPRVVDLARVNDRYFLNVSTGGFPAQATEEAPEKVKRVFGALAYIIAGARSFAALQMSHARFVSGDEVIHDGEFLLYAVGNGRKTGGGNFITPRSNLHDGLLDFCLVKSISHTEFLRLLPDLRSGGHVDNPNVLYRQVAEIRVTPVEELSVNVDGEPLAVEELHYQAVPGALRLAIPSRTST